MSLTKHTAPPLRALLAILVVVALAHAAVLETLPTALPSPAAHTVPALSTRSLPPPAPVVPTPVAEPVATAPVAAPRPPKARPAPPQEDSTVVAVGPAPDPMPEPLPVAPEPAPPAPVPAASEPQPVASAPEPAVSAPTIAAPAPAPAPVPAVTLATEFSFPEPVRLLYALTGESKKLTYHANGELLWQQDGQHYDAQLKASMLFLGSRTRTSSGAVTPEGLAPTRFSDKWRSEVAAHFDQAQHRASFSANTPDVPLQPAAQDQLSVMLHIAGILAAAPDRYTAGSTLTFQTIGPKDADIWQFKVEGPETIRVPDGDVDTLKLTRSPRKEFDQKVEIWLAPRLNYLPARLKITNANGDFVDQQLRGVEKP